MGLTSALNTSLNGLSLNETSIDVLGNNIANAATDGFKASRVLFSTQLARTISVGSGPSPTNGGSNPLQVGLGASTAAIQADFSQGSVTTSSSPSDLAIQGDGFFSLDTGTGGSVYTRNGNFTLNSQDNLVNNQGLKLQGYGVDGSFNLITTGTTDINIPLGQLQVASATKNLSIGGALLSTGAVATQGTLLNSAALVSDTSATPVDATTLLTTTRLASADTVPLFTSGETLTLAPNKGGQTIQAKTLAVTDFTTVGDLMTFMQGAMGLETTSNSATPIPTDTTGDLSPVGVTLNGGVISVKGNEGTVNDIDLPQGSLSGSTGAIPLGFTAAQRANGESTVTNFLAFDSLGQSLNVRVTATLESRNSTSTTFRYFVESPDNSGTNVALGSSTVTFDSQGKEVAQPNNTFSIDRTAASAVSPQLLTIDLSAVSGISTGASGSSLSLVSQDGSSPGTLTSYVIDQSGKINGVFDNGSTRTLGQVVLARFNNPQGLIQTGGDTYSAGVASGLPIIAKPGSFGAGTVRAGAIELSNTDVGKNLVDLIVASTNYQGNARVITAIEQLVQNLLTLGR